MKQSGQLFAGVAEIDVTPAMGVQIAGNIGALRPTRKVEERLFARALVLKQGETRLCYFTSDVLAIRSDYAQAIRRDAESRFKIKPGELIVNCTQNHASPSVGHCFCLDESIWRQWVRGGDLEWVLGGDQGYNVVFHERALSVIGDALGRLQPVTAHAARGTEGRIAFNRRTVMRDGSGAMHAAAGDPNVMYVEGPADPEVSILLLKDRDETPVAALLHFTSHPCHSVDPLTISHGWPGAWCDGMKPLLGGGLPFVVNGCCGDVHPRNPIAPDQTKTYREMGRILTTDAQKIMERLTPVDGPLLNAVRTLRIPLRDLDVVKVRNAERLLAKHPDPMWVNVEKTQISWEWIYAISMIDLARHKEVHPYFDYEVQAFRIGGLSLLALTGEPFVSAQLKIKLNAPAPFTMIAHMSNGYVGYIPTPEAIRRGGFEAEVCNWSKLAVNALDTITDTSIEVLRELAGRG